MMEYSKDTRDDEINLEWTTSNLKEEIEIHEHEISEAVDFYTHKNLQIKEESLHQTVEILRSRLNYCEISISEESLMNVQKQIIVDEVPQKDNFSDILDCYSKDIIGNIEHFYIQIFF